MFTGLVEEVGTIDAAEPLDGGRSFLIRAERVLAELNVGDSISIDGACHTITEVSPDAFGVQSVATTLERTTFGEFVPGRRVNLERALALGQRLGGHLVQGHVDGIGRIVGIMSRDEHVLIDFSLPAIVAEVTVLHGSITLNGVSLTVNALPTSGTAQVSIIPHTWEVTNLSDLATGSSVNLEGDLIGRYVRHLLGRPAAPESREGDTEHLRHAWGYQ